MNIKGKGIKIEACAKSLSKEHLREAFANNLFDYLYDNNLLKIGKDNHNPNWHDWYILELIVLSNDRGE